MTSSDEERVDVCGPPSRRRDKARTSGAPNPPVQLPGNINRPAQQDPSSVMRSGSAQQDPYPFPLHLAVAAKFKKRIEQKEIPNNVLEVIEKQLQELQSLKGRSLDYNKICDYLEWLTMFPWLEYSDENFDMTYAKEVINEDHYGLTSIKNKILKFITALKRNKTSQGKIICLTGPSGVGKTSIARSIARALNRRFCWFSVGGLSDLADIKGHSRSNFGANPGKIVQCLKRAGTANPLLLIDDIDQLGEGHDGDRVSAMLELFDPQQNKDFLDQYLDVPIDLSRVLIVCIANAVEKMPKQLSDRMTVIHFPVYVIHEKMQIARNYLEKTAREACGIKPEQVEVTNSALLTLIKNYCRDGGVRDLQKQIEKIYRKVALCLLRKEHEAGLPDEGVVEAEIVDDSADKDTVEAEKNPETKKVLVDSSNLVYFVGNSDFLSERIYNQTPIGVAMGLIVGVTGGHIVYYETACLEQGDGKGGITFTGRMKEDMKNSVDIAYNVAKDIFHKKYPEDQFFYNTKLHLNVPSLTVTKDGPSAGCTIVTSLLSLAMNKPVKKDLAMTGAINSEGELVSVGFIREKVDGARRNGIKYIVLPSANRSDYDKLLSEEKEGLQERFVNDYSEIFDFVFN